MLKLVFLITCYVFVLGIWNSKRLWFRAYIHITVAYYKVCNYNASVLSFQLFVKVMYDSHILQLNVKNMYMEEKSTEMMHVNWLKVELGKTFRPHSYNP